ncbi:glutamate-1-semialdehyde 2,1-aminomutase [Euzebya tangerina]|uniref:glutamate-1-semialdehyde 2,1-aminomutase n=1 Tax=Euzebya tangerina TaxID=591198 RepID=UPI000E30EDB8|nr:glutamate-1-semialdehyde 2,1-aminomutase [Euzebya tangerina]
MTSAAASTPTSDRLFDRAQAVIPGGVNSPVRAFRGVGGTPRFMSNGKGSRVTDEDGTSYLDYVMSWGPLILGHAHPDVVQAAIEATRTGSSYGAPTRGEIELAEEIVARVPGVEMVRCVSSGTEAAMSAIRVARGATGRTKVIKFAGHYHGHADSLLVEAGSGVATLALPNSPGVTAGATQDTIVVPWNDTAAVEAAFEEYGDDIAVIACEPVAANMGLVPAQPGLHGFLRQISRDHGALLLVDEVMTGFRLARGGATELLGLEPDLVAFGKVVGGGFPLAAFGGPREVMELLAPVGPVYQAGTLSGNPVAVAAGLTQLRLLDEAAYSRLDQLATRLIDGWTAAFAAAGVPAVIQRVASLFGLYFTSSPVTDFEGARAADHERYAAFFHGMLRQGVYLPPSGYEAMFVSTAHSEEDIDATIAAARTVAATLPGR